MGVEKIVIELSFPLGGLLEWLESKIDLTDIVFDGWERILGKLPELSGSVSAMDLLDALDGAVSYATDDDHGFSLMGGLPDDERLVEAYKIVAVISGAARFGAEGAATFVDCQFEEEPPSIPGCGSQTTTSTTKTSASAKPTPTSSGLFATSA